ncbi:hypothetical protein SLS59_006282 [Nothophoma quercina]|uniref:Uncharacterized protein n=1 Tax=Nothophoma quercina TaxID=749835 RepID=A0ABR3R4A6_9PLEO
MSFYHLASSLKVAHLIEFNEVGQKATVEQLPDMHDGQCVNPGGELRVRMEGSAEGLRFLLIKIGSMMRNINND